MKPDRERGWGDEDADRTARPAHAALMRAFERRGVKRICERRSLCRGSLEQRGLVFLRLWGSAAQDLERPRGGDPAAGRADDVLLTQQVRLDLVGERVGGEVHGGPEGFNPGRA